MKIPTLIDPVLVDTQGMKIRVSTVLFVVWDLFLAPTLTPNENERNPR